MAPLKNTRFGHYFGWWTGKDGNLEDIKVALEKFSIQDPKSSMSMERMMVIVKLS